MGKKKFDPTDCYIADKSFDKLEDEIKKNLGRNSVICFNKIEGKWKGKIENSSMVISTEDQYVKPVEFSGLQDSDSCRESVIPLKNEFDIKEVRKKYLTKMGCYKRK